MYTGHIVFPVLLLTCKNRTQNVVHKKECYSQAQPWSSTQNYCDCPHRKQSEQVEKNLLMDRWIRAVLHVRTVLVGFQSTIFINVWSGITEMTFYTCSSHYVKVCSESGPWAVALRSSTASSQHCSRHWGNAVNNCSWLHVYLKHAIICMLQGSPCNACSPIMYIAVTLLGSVQYQWWVLL